MDEKIDKIIKEVWNCYDPKGIGVLPKKIIQQFFKVDLYFEVENKLLNLSGYPRSLCTSSGKKK
jgi:hypothetical protein